MNSRFVATSFLRPTAMALALSALTVTVASCGLGSAEETEVADVDPELAEAMPEAMIGQWRIADGSVRDEEACNTMAASAAGLVVRVRADGFGYFEEGGIVTEVHEVGDRRIDATFDTTYVELQESRIAFELIDDAATGEEILRATPADDSFFVDIVDHVRCPDVATDEAAE